ncbi:POL5 [Hepatospora eriocheir]|uniref:POL5 n=1 Tax=Hepatospora eriocheir TaxID=1081669 RepID=A0A1X0Q7Q7_9MICR|nr:POL5 [Hepatospora eriocheir]
MYIVLSKHIGKNVQVYMNDIIMATETIDQHYEILNDVLLTLVRFCLQISQSKSVFLQRSIIFLGYKIFDGKIFIVDVTYSTNTHETVCDLFHTKHKNN